VQYKPRFLAPGELLPEHRDKEQGAPGKKLIKGSKKGSKKKSAAFTSSDDSSSSDEETSSSSSDDSSSSSNDSSSSGDSSSSSGSDSDSSGEQNIALFFQPHTSLCFVPVSIFSLLKRVVLP